MDLFHMSTKCNDWLPIGARADSGRVILPHSELQSTAVFCSTLIKSKRKHLSCLQWLFSLNVKMPSSCDKNSCYCRIHTNLRKHFRVRGFSFHSPKTSTLGKFTTLDCPSVWVGIAVCVCVGPVITWWLVQAVPHPQPMTDGIGSRSPARKWMDSYVVWAWDQ